MDKSMSNGVVDGLQVNPKDGRGDPQPRATKPIQSSLDDVSWQRQLAAGGVLSQAQWQQLTPDQQQQWRQHAQARADMDQQLRLAMQIPVPAQLADKILLAQSFALLNAQPKGQHVPATWDQATQSGHVAKPDPRFAPQPCSPDHATEHATEHATASKSQPMDDISQTRVVPFPSKQIATLSANERHWVTKYALASAASVFFISGLWLSMAWWTPWSSLSQDSQTLASHTFAHIYHELDALSSTAEVERATVNHMLQDWQLTLADDTAPLVIQNQAVDQPGLMRFGVQYARFCDFAGVRSLHLVFSTPQGPVTVFVLPRKHALDGEYQFADERFHGQRVLLANVRAQAATDVVVVGAKSIQLEPIILQIQQQLKPMTV